MFKKVFSLSLIALMLFSCLGSINALPNFNNKVVVDVGTNGWAASSIEIWDQNGGYYKKENAPAASRSYQKVFYIPDTSKWHNLEVKFNHGISGQGPSIYVVICAYTTGEAKLKFETYGDDVEGHYKGLHKYWNDKYENHFWLG